MDGQSIGRASPSGERIGSLIDAAKQAARGGRLQDAERMMRQAELEAPRHPLVLNEKAARAIAAGDHASAHTILLTALESDRFNPELWFNLAIALRGLYRIGDAVAALDRILAQEPRHLRALLERGALQELQDLPRAAAVSYRQALTLIPPQAAVPPWMEAQVKQARACVDANSIALERYIEEGLSDLRARFAGASFDRFDQCLATMVQKRAIYRQQPSFLYFPELPTIEFYERHHFPWLDRIEAAADDIRGELLDVLGDGPQSLAPYVASAGEVPADALGGLNNSKRWSVYSFYREGKSYPEHIARCPRTIAALKEAPAWDVPDCGPTSMFSLLDAHTRIPPHTGPVNTRLVVHLPLIVPPGCGFRVGGTTRQWEPGKAFVFDDSINHEAWNDSDEMRAVLIFDIWSPFLSAAECALTRALTVRIGEYYGTAGVGPDTLR